jgi:hypothetical protein
MVEWQTCVSTVRSGSALFRRSTAVQAQPGFMEGAWLTTLDLMLQSWRRLSLSDFNLTKAVTARSMADTTRPAMPPQRTLCTTYVHRQGP